MQHAALFRDFDTPSRFHIKLDAALALEKAQLFGYRWLADFYFSGGLGNACLFCDGAEYLQLVESHSNIL
jgi:hypothetical protein